MILHFILRNYLPSCSSSLPRPGLCWPCTSAATFPPWKILKYYHNSYRVMHVNYALPKGFYCNSVLSSLQMLVYFQKAWNRPRFLKTPWQRFELSPTALSLMHSLLIHIIIVTSFLFVAVESRRHVVHDPRSTVQAQNTKWWISFAETRISVAFFWLI